MEITNVKITKTEMNRVKGIASITIDNCFVVHNIKIIESQNGLFIRMPSIKTADGTFKDIAHPINSEARDKIQKAILEEYEREEK